MQSKERANLRAEAHHLQVLVHVGHAGATDAVIRTIDELLQARELIKVESAATSTNPVKDLAHAIAEATGAEVIQVIGRKVALYRDNPDLKWKNGVAAVEVAVER